MHRFYINRVSAESATLTGVDQVHHIRDVLRLKAGDRLLIFDRDQQEYLCTITGLGDKEVNLAVLEKKQPQARRWRFSCACALPKKDGMDQVIDNLTQLGADAIYPMQTERVVVKLDEKGRKARLERWRKLAQAAAEQSQRSSLPYVGAVSSLQDILSGAAGYDLRLIATLAGERRRLGEIITRSRPENILFLVGPEGDFTPGEVELALAVGFIPVSLGDTVLRVSTAAIAIASYIRLAFD